MAAVCGCGADASRTLHIVYVDPERRDHHPERRSLGSQCGTTNRLHEFAAVHDNVVIGHFEPGQYPASQVCDAARHIPDPQGEHQPLIDRSAITQVHISQKPLVLYSNLPRLVEAVVKSLDPNASANRDAILDSATEILSHIVQRYPPIYLIHRNLLLTPTSAVFPPLIFTWEVNASLLERAKAQW